MSTAQSNTSGQYSVAVDNQNQTVIDGFTNSKSASCGFSWSASGLQNALHTVVVTTMGQSASAGSGNGVSNFELDGFVITQAENVSGASSDAPLNFNFASSIRIFVVFAVTTLFTSIYA